MSVFPTRSSRLRGPGLAMATALISLAFTASACDDGTAGGDDGGGMEPSNEEPSASIEAPSQDTTVSSGDPVSFQGSGSDPEDGMLTGASLEWRSDLDGSLGTGQNLDATLTDGDHIVTLTATDSDGATGEDAVMVDVESSGGSGAIVAVMVADTGWNAVLENDGAGNLTDSGQRLGDIRSLSVATGDLDGDGDTDAIVGNTDGIRVWFNEGSGTFDDGEQWGSGNVRAVALGDLSGVNGLDAFLAKGDGSNQARYNDGSGGFAGGSGAGVNGQDVALGDVDEDGSLDAVIARNGANGVWPNNGNGFFLEEGPRLGSANSNGIALGDLNGDNHLDVVVANGGPNRVWLGNGQGDFDQGDQELGSGGEDVALGDLNGDNHLDVVVVNDDGANRVWLNDGSGGLTDGGQSLGSGGEGIALGDLNGDNHLDAFVAAGTHSGGNALWLNDGSGVFTDTDQTLGVGNAAAFIRAPSGG